LRALRRAASAHGRPGSKLGRTALSRTAVQDASPSPRLLALFEGPSGELALFAVVAAIAFAMRLPFLGPGYGTDADAWGVAYAARQIAETGRYYPSRFPGYPVHEFVCSWLWRGGPELLCGASALMSATAAGLFALLFRRLGGREALLAGVALASVPAVHIAAVQSLDHVWSLAFALAALYAAVRSQPLLSGALLGLAVGCRLPSLVWAAPLAAMLAVAVERPRRRVSLVRFAIATLTVALLAFLPLLLGSGLGFLHFYEQGPIPLLWVLKQASVDVWGVPGTLALAIAIPRAVASDSGRARAAALEPPPHALVQWGWLAGITGIALVFARLPHDPAYLLPAVPLLLLWLAGRLRLGLFRVLALALCLSPWFAKVRNADPGEGRAAWVVGPVHAGGRTYVLDLLTGPALDQQHRRVEQLLERDQLLAHARGLRGAHVLVIHGWMPMVRTTLDGWQLGEVTFVEKLTSEQVRERQARGVTVYDLFGEVAPWPWTDDVEGSAHRRSVERN